MDRFDASGAELRVGGLPLSRLAERVGQTPFYAYDRSLIAARIAAVRLVLPPGVRLHYAIKANPMAALVGFLCPLVDGMDVASAGELKLALDAGADPLSIGFAGPGKRAAELRQAVASGVLLHVESARELQLLAKAAQDLGMPARVALRINPDFELRGAGMHMGGGRPVRAQKKISRHGRVRMEGRLKRHCAAVGPNCQARGRKRPHGRNHRRAG